MHWPFRRSRMDRSNMTSHTAHGKLRILFLGVTCLLVLAAWYTSLLILERQRSLEAVSRYNSTWVLSQAATELARLEGTVAAYAIAGTNVDRDDVQLRLDILTNRIRMLDDSEVRDFMRSSPGWAAIGNEFRDVAAAAQLMVDDLDRPGVLQDLLGRLARLNPKLLRLASAAHAAGGLMASDDMAELSRLHWVFSGVLFALIICGFALIGVLSWNNRLLIRAHADVNELVGDLQRTSVELSAANERAQSAMTEVNSRNEILQARDSELNTQNALFDAALNNMSQALCMVDSHQQLIVCNARFQDMFGLHPGEVAPGTQARDVFKAIARAGKISPALIEGIRAEQQSLVFSHSPGSFLREIDQGPALAVSHKPMIGGGWLATYEDVTEQRQAEARIRFMAHHDGLTRLANRVLLHERMAEMLRDPRPGERLAVLCLDLDHFKNVNDTLGHPVGDALLKAVADRLRNCVRADDVIARMGGDEFALLQRSADQPRDAEQLAQRIVESLCKPYALDGNRAIIGTSVGIVIAPERGADADTLMKCADMALYRAKSDGRGTYRFFEAEMDAQLQARHTMELNLREARARQELMLFYQPVIDLATNSLSGFEALLRWQHPTLGMIPPADFIPLAEELGLIVPIGEWAIEQACREAATWPDSLKIAVNLSPVQFRSEYLEASIDRAISQSGLDPRRLELEITETTLLKDTDKVTAVLHRLRNRGLRTVLDDFGTGYSSLSYLRSFPFDKLKIDQSFVREMAHRPDCLAIVNSVAALASKLGITTTAEGVETAEHIDQVRHAGCAEAQGYFYDRPRPGSAIRHWFARTTERIVA